MAVTRRKFSKSRGPRTTKPTFLGLVQRLDPGPFETTHFLRDLDLAARKAERSNKPVRMTVVIDPRQPQPRIAVASAAPESFNTSEAALQAARKRGAERIADILGGEDMLSADAFADEIGATRETVNNKRKRHEILGLEGPKRGIRFPKWQLSRSGELLPGLPELFEALGGHPWSVYRFLLAEHPEFDGKRGLDALRSGPAAEIIAVARSIRSGTFS